METIIGLLPVLTCPIMMGLLVWMMSRNNTGNNNASTATTDMTVQRVQRVQNAQNMQNTQNMQSAPEPVRVAAAIASPLCAAVDMIKCCLNPKVLAGLAVVGVGVLVFAPNIAASVLPLLIVLACPLSMLFMMRGMRGQMNGSTNGAACEHCAPQQVQEQTRQPVVIDQVASPKPEKLPANAGETIELAQASQASQERKGKLVFNPSWDG